MHAMKGGASDYGSVSGEALDRKKSKVGTIDYTKSYLNYNLCSREAPTDINEFIKNLGVTRKIRDDAVLFVSVIVDYPADEIRDKKTFFEDACKGLQEHFNIKDESILYAQVHMDENHPHMHFSFVPIVEKTKTYKSGHEEVQIKLSAKEVLTKQSLNNLHPFMTKYMRNRGYIGTIHKADGEIRNKDFLEYKLEQIEKDIAKKSEMLMQSQDNLTALNSQIIQLEEKKKELDDSVKIVQSSFNSIYDKGVELSETNRQLQEENSKLKSNISENRDLITVQEKQIEEKMENIRKLETKVNELSGYIGFLNEKIDHFFDGVIERFKKGLREAFNLAKQDDRPETTVRSIEKVNKTENEAIADVEKVSTQRVSVKQKLDEKKVEVKQGIHDNSEKARNVINTRRRSR